MNVNIEEPKSNLLESSRKRAIDDILLTYNSDAFTNVKNNTLRTIDLLYKLGYYKDSESLFPKER